MRSDLPGIVTSEEGDVGWGETKEEAIAELLATQGETPDGTCTYCGKPADRTQACSVGGCPIGNDA